MLSNLIHFCRRVKRIGVGIAVCGSVIMLLLWCATAFIPSSNPMPYGALVVMVGLPVFWGGVIYAGGWVIEGFLQPSTKRR
jgi:hypothetical protein